MKLASALVQYLDARVQEVPKMPIKDRGQGVQVGLHILELRIPERRS